MAENQQQPEPEFPDARQLRLIHLLTSALQGRPLKCKVICGTAGIGKSIGIETYLQHKKK